MKLTDADIKKEIQNGNIIYKNGHPDNIGNSSIDVRWGKWVEVFWIDEYEKKHTPPDERGLRFKPINEAGKIQVEKPLYLHSSKYDLEIMETITLKPGEFVLAETYEYLGIAEKCRNIVAECADKSTMVRWAAATHFNGGYIDIGNALKVTLEIKNNFIEEQTFYYKAHIAQVVFSRCESECERSYDGKYKNSESVEKGR
jgi:deoxycytidine triphosphate deaminase